MQWEVAFGNVPRYTAVASKLTTFPLASDMAAASALGA